MSSIDEDVPQRPALSPLVVAALCSWLAIIFMESLTWQAYIGEISLPRALPLPMLAIALATFAAIRIKRRKRTVTMSEIFKTFALPILACSVSLICSALFWSAWDREVQEMTDVMGTGATITVDLTSDPSRRDNGTVSWAELHRGSHAIAFRLLWPESDDPLPAGHRIQLQGKLSPPNEDDSGRWNHQNGSVGMLKAAQVLDAGYAHNLRGFVTSFRDASFERIASLDVDASALLSGILLGNKTRFDGTELQLAFQTTGLAHLMAVSGTHLAIVMLLATQMLAMTKMRRKPRNALLLMALLLYVALTGFAPSAMRAWVMGAAALLLGSFERRGSSLSALAFCAFAFLNTSPSMAFSMGFQLSVLSVLGLVIFTPLGQAWIEQIAPWIPKGLATSVTATIAASTMTLPITVGRFAQLPLASPLSNILVAPLVTAALAMGIVALSVCTIIEPLGMLLLDAAGALAMACAKVVHLLADLPFSCLPISIGSKTVGFIFAGLIIVLWIVWPLPGEHAHHGHCPERKASSRCASSRRRSRLGTTIIPLAICIIPLLVIMGFGFGQQSAPVPASNARIAMLDVGQGDSFLVQSGDASVLIDTGEDSDALIRELAEQGITRLDAIFLTHKDADHAGALRKIAGIIGVDHVYVHEDLLGHAAMTQVLESARWATNGSGAEGVRRGSRFTIGEFALFVLGPELGGASENEDSLIMLLEHDANHDGLADTRGIFTGDAERDALQSHVSRIGDIDFMKVAHHGSKNGVTDEQLEELRPEVVLISVGADNKYGHPHRETLAQCERIGARIYRTDRQGAVTMIFDERGYSVFTERD